jgi:SAM-dependent methyltransferase
MMIMCDFCVLSPEQQRIMLEKWSRFLKPGGALLFDVYSLPGYEARKPRDEFKENLMDGFFSAEKYFGFVKTFKYDDEKVVLDKYTVIEETRTRVLYNWLQFYDREILKRTIEEAGLGVEEFLGDVAGAQFDAEGSEFAVVARKPQ